MIDKHLNYILSIRWVDYILIEIIFRNNFQLLNVWRFFYRKLKINSIKNINLSACEKKQFLSFNCEYFYYYHCN